ncbi:MAG: sugar nucleotide-binding protein [Halanaerobiales bacterium]|nr:sugar nucleotide-binding protein [Halanaerobiales bacterium]
MSKLLILGASGLVGKALIKELNKDFDVYGTYYSRKLDLLSDRTFKLDVNDLNSIKEILRKVSPELVISCLRGDFSEQLLVHTEVAKYLKDIDGKLYFCSTANVFDNDITKPHYEYDELNAESEYGKFKVECEQKLKEILGDNLCILRLPMLWGKDSPRYNDILDKINNDEEIEIYSNLYLTNNTDVMLAKQIHYIINNDLKGEFHLATEDVITHSEFVNELIIRLGYKDVKMKESKIAEEKFVLSIVSNRKELTDDLKISNKDILSYFAK